MSKQVFEIVGIEAINKALAEVPEEFRDNVAMKATKDAANILLEEARQQCPIGPSRDIFGRYRQPGRLKASLKMIGKKTKTGVDVSVRPTGKAANYAHLVEFGHRIVIYGQQEGFAAPNAFMTRSFDAKAVEANNRGIDLIGKGFLDVLSKRVKKAMKK